ncbi:MAG TPA: AAA+ family ATPase, partial [Chloroflexota bacterium]
VPVQATPQAAVAWQAIRLSGQDALAVRASKKLVSEELVFTGMAGTRLRHELDRVPLWRDNHVGAKQLAEDFARYVYLPRLKDSPVLTSAIRDGIGLLTWERETFAYADSYDEARGSYTGLKTGEVITPLLDSQSVIVKPEAARKQLDEDAQASAGFGPFSLGTSIEHALPRGAVHNGHGSYDPDAPAAPAAPKKPRRFHGTVPLRAKLVTGDAGKIADEVIQHLTSLLGAEVEVTLEIQANVPDGVPDNVVRIVTENANTLKFTSQGFEEE